VHKPEPTNNITSFIGKSEHGHFRWSGRWHVC